ncbi:MAG: hypothetical protein NTW94_07280 [Legionellales bacterium]|nr:hypothetical protein [Legionellales bacterium]
MKRRVLSVDFDGCLFHMRYIQAKGVNKDVVRQNMVFLAGIISGNAAYDAIVTMVGSGRQSKLHDDNGFDFRGSCFLALGLITNYLKVKKGQTVSMDGFILADIYGNLPPGTSFKNATERTIPYSEHAKWVFDITKVTILYAQMHKQAMDHPSDDIDFDFFDDRIDILDALKDFFSTHHELIPKNVKLQTHLYSGGPVTPMISINGSGCIDVNYANTVKQMANIALDREHPHEFTDACFRRCIESVSRVSPEGLTVRSPLTTEAMLRESPAKRDRKPNVSVVLQTHFMAQLDAIAEKACDLRKEDQIALAEVVMTLHTTLKAKSSDYFEQKLPASSFRSESASAIHEARMILPRDMVWSSVFFRLALSLNALQVGYLAIPGCFKLTKPEDNPFVSATSPVVSKEKRA